MNTKHFLNTAFFATILLIQTSPLFGVKTSSPALSNFATNLNECIDSYLAIVDECQANPAPHNEIFTTYITVQRASCANHITLITDTFRREAREESSTPDQLLEKYEEVTASLQKKRDELHNRLVEVGWTSDN